MTVATQSLEPQRQDTPTAPGGRAPAGRLCFVPTGSVGAQAAHCAFAGQGFPPGERGGPQGAQQGRKLLGAQVQCPGLHKGATSPPCPEAAPGKLETRPECSAWGRQRADVIALEKHLETHRRVC